MRILIALILLLQNLSPLQAQNLTNWSTAASIFDGKSLAGAVRPGPITPDIWGPGGVPRKKSKDLPKGIGPVSFEKNPTYLTGLLGGLSGLILAPIAFVLEAAQAVALTPLRMMRGLAKGDWFSILEPLRTVKNLAQDYLMFSVGMLNLLTAPVWNAFRPDEATDFIYANNRLIFLGGPIMELNPFLFGGIRPRAFAPSWHSVFMRRATLGNLRGGTSPTQTFHHEFVHNKQWQKSFFAEHLGENYNRFKGWRDADAEEYLNW